MKPSAFLLVLLLSFASFAASKKQPTQHELRKGSIIATTAEPEDFAFPAKFAGENGVLMNTSEAVTYAPFDGKKFVKIDPYTTSELSKLNRCPAIASDGSDIYVVMITDPDESGHQYFYLAKYQLDGSYRSKAKIDYPFFQVHHIAALGNDQLIIAGFEVVLNSYGKPQYKHVVGLFGSNGQYLRPIMLPNSLAFAGEGQKTSLTMNSNAQMEETAGAAIFDRTDSGDVFMIMKALAEAKTQMAPVMFIIKPSLEVRRIELEKPDNGRFYAAKVKGDRIAAVYVESKDASERAHGVLRIFDLNGKLQTEYRYDLDVFGVGLVDWTPGRLLMATQTGKIKDGIKFAYIEALQ